MVYIVSRHLYPVCYNFAFVWAYQMGMTNGRTPNIQGELQMWFPMLQAVTGKLYVISHFYNMCVVVYLCSNHAHLLVAGFAVILVRCSNKSSRRRT